MTTDIDYIDCPGPLTVYLHLTDDCPTLIMCKAAGDDRIFYNRKITGRNKLQMNFPSPPPRLAICVFGNSIKSLVLSDLKRAPINPVLPPSIRPFDVNQLRIVPNDSISGPAQFHVSQPLIEINPKEWERFDEPTKRFVLLHEICHTYATDEQTTDLLATQLFLCEGWNVHQALYALTDVLHPTEFNRDRMVNICGYLNKLQNLGYA